MFSVQLFEMFPHAHYLCLYFRNCVLELKALIDVEYEKARAETGQPRDLGAVVNSQLASNVTRMSKRASVARRASVVSVSYLAVSAPSRGSART